MMKLMEDNALDFIQINYSMMEPEAANDILPLAQETGTAVIINRPDSFCESFFERYIEPVRLRNTPWWV